MHVAIKGLEGPTPLVQSLAKGPPIVWSGWTGASQARDWIRWPGLHLLVQRYLESIPLYPATLP
jgi:hypothetical protein